MVLKLIEESRFQLRIRMPLKDKKILVPLEDCLLENDIRILDVSEIYENDKELIYNFVVSSKVCCGHMITVAVRKFFTDNKIDYKKEQIKCDRAFFTKREI